MKKVLIITYYWPPSGGPGVQRVLKFAKYLPQFGWQPIILTVKDGEYPAIDESLFNDIPKDCFVYKIKSIEPGQLYRKLTGMKKSDKIPIAALSDKNISLKKRIAHWIRLNIFIPDAKIGMIHSFRKKANEILKEHKVNAILSSSPPHSIQLAARKIAKKNQLPWVCDLRDPWTDIYHYDKVKRFFLSEWLDKLFEKSILRNAKKVITVSPYFVRRFNLKGNREDVIFIPNGFDLDDIKSTANKSNKTSDKFVISYVGNMTPNQNVNSLWQVIRELIDNDSEFEKYFSLWLVGQIHPDVKKSIAKNNLEQFVDYKGYLPHCDAYSITKNSTVLLFIIGRSRHNKGVLTGKLFEYISTKNPILSIGPVDGDASKILKEVGLSKMCDYKDKNGIKKTLKVLFKDWKSGDLNRYATDKNLDKYSREKLTEKLVRNIE